MKFEKLDLLADKLANIDFDEIRRREYALDRENINNFSYWYPKVKDCGMLMVPCRYKTIPLDTYLNMMGVLDGNPDKWLEFEEYIKAFISEWDIQDNVIYSIKNGCYSDKFSNCNVLGKDIPKKFVELTYNSICYETGGFTEIVVRDYIDYNKQKTPTIYNGLPLRSEFRVFVDFDTKEILYIVNYWDYDYCSSGIVDINDKIIFDYMKEPLEKEYELSKDNVLKEVQKVVDNNKELKGQWSIDVLKENGKYYLIDMAIAHRSAYYDAKRCHKK